MKIVILAILFLVSNVCWADDGDFSRKTAFASPEQFVEAASNFRPSAKPSEFSYIFAAPELADYDDPPDYGRMVFADTIDTVVELSRSPDVRAYFIQAAPKTQYTHSSTAGLFILQRSDRSGIWRITNIERFFANGIEGGIECKVIRRTKPLTFRITETDAGRRDVLQERVYTLADADGPRLKPVSIKKH